MQRFKLLVGCGHLCTRRVLRGLQLCVHREESVEVFLFRARRLFHEVEQGIAHARKLARRVGVAAKRKPGQPPELGLHRSEAVFSIKVGAPGKQVVPGLTKALVQPFPCALERLRGIDLLIDRVDLFLYRLLLQLDPLLFQRVHLRPERIVFGLRGILRGLRRLRRVKLQQFRDLRRTFPELLDRLPQLVGLRYGPAHLIGIAVHSRPPLRDGLVERAQHFLRGLFHHLGAHGLHLRKLPFRGPDDLKCLFALIHGLVRRLHRLRVGRKWVQGLVQRLDVVVDEGVPVLIDEARRVLRVHPGILHALRPCVELRLGGLRLLLHLG